MIITVVMAASGGEFGRIADTVRLATHHFRVVHTAPSLTKAMGALRKAKPRVFLMGLDLPDPHDLGLIRTVQRELPTRVVVMCRRENAGTAVEALGSGATGYVLTGMANETVVRLLRAAAA
jgi:DNA-binding NarL/FixJ family response regulator